MNVTNNPLDTAINDWAKLLTNLIVAKKKTALTEANTKLDPKQKDEQYQELEDEFKEQFKELETEFNLLEVQYKVPAI